jgi:inner membrane protein
MIFGHLPAGYILTKKLQKYFRYSQYLWVGLLASILPDVDISYIIYTYLFYDKVESHHNYWTHIPFFWILSALVVFAVVKLKKRAEHIFVFAFFFLNILLHIFLDFLTGGKIKWFYPLSDRSFSGFEGPALYRLWIFPFRWTLSLEIILIVWALIIFINEMRKKRGFQEKRTHGKP